MEDVIKYNGGAVLTNDDIKTLEQSGIIPKGTPEAQIKLFAKVCAEKNLSPFSKQIHLIPRGGKYTFQTAIDGFRTIAERSGVYAGNDDYKFDEGLSEYEMIKNKRNSPTTATATVYKVVGNIRCPFSATARWDEYYPGESLGFMWKKMPFLMLGKCAESLALRKAFPESLGGLYTNEEMQQAEIMPVQEKSPQENLTEKYEKLFKGKSPEEIKETYKNLAAQEKGKDSIAVKEATFWAEEYRKNNSLMDEEQKLFSPEQYDNPDYFIEQINTKKSSKDLMVFLKKHKTDLEMFGGEDHLKIAKAIDMREAILNANQKAE